MCGNVRESLVGNAALFFLFTEGTPLDFTRNKAIIQTWICIHWKLNLHAEIGLMRRLSSAELHFWAKEVVLF